MPFMFENLKVYQKAVYLEVISKMLSSPDKRAGKKKSIKSEQMKYVAAE